VAAEKSIKNVAVLSTKYPSRSIDELRLHRDGESIFGVPTSNGEDLRCSLVIRSLKKMIHELRLHWKHYVSQSLLAALVVFVVILALNIDNDAVIIASIGATAFIVFAMPNSVTAKPRNVIGGHLIGLACGFIATRIPVSSCINPAIGQASLYAFAVGTSIFIMVVTDTEHPPAAGTALGTVIRGISSRVTIAVIAGALLLSLIRRLFKPHLRDLT